MLFQDLFIGDLDELGNGFYLKTALQEQIEVLDFIHESTNLFLQGDIVMVFVVCDNCKDRKRRSLL